MKLLGDEIMWNLIFVLLEIVLVSLHDKCMVCAKCTIGSEIIWMHPKVLLGDEAQVEARFGLIGDSGSLVCAEHTIGSEIVLDVPDGTSR
jgi:hypothetical protein